MKGESASARCHSYLQLAKNFSSICFKLLQSISFRTFILSETKSSVWTNECGSVLIYLCQMELVMK